MYFLLGLSLFLSACITSRMGLLEEQKNQSVEDAQPLPVSHELIDDLKHELAQLGLRIQKIEVQASQWDALILTVQKNQEKEQDLEKHLSSYHLNVESLHNSVESLEKKLSDLVNEKENPELLKKAKVAFKSTRQTQQDEVVVLLTQYLKCSKAKGFAEALFLRGQTYFKLKEYKKAIVDYSQLYEKVPKSSYCPEALYKMMKSFEALSMTVEAKGMYQELCEKFPQSSFVKRKK
jgi:TolA-binding protein